MSNNIHKIEVKIEKEEFNAAIDEAFNKASKDIKIDGFRKGKVTREIYEQKFGVESLYTDAVDIAIPSAYSKMLTESKLEPVVRPDIDVKTINEDGIVFEFTVTTKPEVKLGDYKSLKVKKEKVEVTDEDINKEIATLTEKFAEMALKEEGAVEQGDTAVIDFEGFRDGIAFDGGKGENYSLEIGSNTFIPGFEEQLVGMNTGEEKAVELTFPMDYPSEDLKGADVIFNVKLHEIKTRITPEMDKAFFKDLEMEGVDSEETLRATLKEQLEATKETELENKYIDNVLAAAGKVTEVDIPEGMIAEEVERIFGQTEQNIKMQGIELEQYLGFLGKDVAGFKEELKGEATNRVKYRLMLEAIAEKEKIEVTEEDAKVKAKELSEKYQMEEEEFLAAFGGLEMMKYDEKMRRTINILKGE